MSFNAIESSGMPRRKRMLLSEYNTAAILYFLSYYIYNEPFLDSYHQWSIIMRRTVVLGTQLLETAIVKE